MKLLAFILLSLIVLLQYPLWFDKGNWLKVWQIDQEVLAKRQNNRKLNNRNTILAAEVKDLKQGFDAIEERARSELGMIKHDEILFQIVDSSHFTPASPEMSGDMHHNTAPNQ